MTNDYKYHLANRNDSRENRKKRSCPHCGHPTFVLYIDTNTGQPLHETVGKCDRADKCAWHYTPRQYFADKGISFDKSNSYPPAGSYGQQSPETKPKRTEPEPSYMDMGIAEKTLCQYENNNFVLWLREQVGEEAANEALRRYYVGTSKHWQGATTFPQIDMEGRVRGIKIMQYDATGHRVKVNGRPRITWAHTLLNLPDYNLSQCLFGEHLLAGNNNIAAIVESEKTALIYSSRRPDRVWLATGGKQNFSLIEEAAAAGYFDGRKIVLYPDLGVTAEWEAKARKLRRKYKLDISVNYRLEKRATEQERADGLDIADFLLRTAPPKATEAPQPATPTETPAIERLQPEAIKSIAEQETPAEGKETAQNRADEVLKRMEYRKQFQIDFTNPPPPPDEDGRVKDVLVLLKWGAVPYSYILSELKESTGERGIDVYFRYVKPAIERGIIRKGKDGMCRLAAGMPQPFQEFWELIAPWHNLRNHKDG
jgi:hypothetical protein